MPTQRALASAFVVISSVICIICGHPQVPEYVAEVNEGSYIPPHLAAIQAYRRSVSVSSALKTLDKDILTTLSQISPETVLRSGINANEQVVSDNCSNAIDFVLAEMLSGQSWPGNLLDSWGRVGSGFLQGNFKSRGAYDECLVIEVARPVNSSLNTPTFKTNYCTAYLNVVPKVITLQLGVCVPQQCSSEDVTQLFNTTIGELISGASVLCQNQDYTMDAGSIVAVVFVMIVVTLCVLATVFEGLLMLRSSWQACPRNMLLNGSSGEKTPLLGPGQSAAKPPEKGLLTKTILAFSLYSNAGKILNTDQPAGALTCLNGIRFFSMTWVILGHTLIFYCFSLMKNVTFAQEVMQNFASMAIMDATLSVDTFFILSGLLVSYLFLKDFHRRRVQIKDFFKALPLIYLHRYLRLTPAYGFMIILTASVGWFWWDGPGWPNPTTPPFRTFDQNCISNWYLNLLYVNNLFGTDKPCAGWGWYLANDTQFFIFAPFIVFTFYLSVYFGLAACIASILGSIVAAIVVADEQHATMTVSTFAHYNYTMLPPSKLGLYSVPWTRYQTYGVGLLAGFLVWKFKQMNYRIPPLLNLLLWGVSAGLCMAVVYGPYSANQGYHTVTLAEADLYNGLSRTAWALGVSYVIISCCLGQGGWVNEFLSWKGFVPLSRLTYCAYLIHIPIISILIGGARSGVYYSYVHIAIDVILLVTLAFTIAFVFSLLFEAPFINLDKLYLAPRSIKRKHEEKEQAPTPQSQKHQISGAGPQ